MKRQLLNWIESGSAPDWVIRQSIRFLLHRRLTQERQGGAEHWHTAQRALFEKLCAGPIAIETDKANEQHYELPPEFFEMCLGPRLKYSSAYWPDGAHTLAEAEDAMLEMTARRARIEDGMDILELGCGWGSFTLWAAERFPRCRILAVSNSAPQRQFILARAKERGFHNIEVETANVTHFDTLRRFDRAVSIEMFEHVRNHPALMARIASWLKPGGRLFVHIFTHRELAYVFEPQDDLDWMARHFFTGGMMPSDSWLLYCQRDLQIENHWRVNGRHYQRTLEAWLARQDASRASILPVFERVYGVASARRWFQRWRIFFMACAELFGFRQGDEWFVSHYLFSKPRSSADSGAATAP